MRGWITVAGALLVAQLAQAQLPVRELTTTPIDLFFVDAVDNPGLPATLTYRLNDRDSKLPLLDDTLIADPSSQPCPDAEPGCVTIVIPAAANLIVGTCKGYPTKACRTSADCPASARCTASTAAFQDHVLTVSWTFAGGSSPDAIVLRTRNLEFAGP